MPSLNKPGNLVWFFWLRATALVASSVHTTSDGHANSFLETETAIYTLSHEAVSQTMAQHLCNSHNGNLVSIEDVDEDKLISEKLTSQGIDFVWTSGISFSNDTLEDFYLWTGTSKPFTYTNFPTARLRRLVRNRRAPPQDIQKDCCDNCCECPTTLPPFTPPRCHRPTCNVIMPPPCNQTEPRQCIVARPPHCSAKRGDCSVECGECRIVKQPECTVKPQTRPRCYIKHHNGKCETKPPRCKVVEPGACRSIQPECQPDYSNSCQAISKPCNSSCAERHCTTVQLPCFTTPQPCVQPQPTTCPPSPSIQCKCDKTSKGANCQCPTAPPPPCPVPEPSCPPPITECPLPTTVCRPPFVDCVSVCQSSVFICNPPKVTCPPPIIQCDPPQVTCDKAEVVCEDPEVVCETNESQITCTPAVVECPDAIVHCNATVTSCEHASTTCSEPIMECPQGPTVKCDKAEVCELTTSEPPTTTTSSPCPCNNCNNGHPCDNNCNSGRTKRESSLPGTEFVETTKCIVMRKDMGFKWDVQSCDLNYHFVCEIKK